MHFPAKGFFIIFFCIPIRVYSHFSSEIFAQIFHDIVVYYTTISNFNEIFYQHCDIAQLVHTISIKKQNADKFATFKQRYV